MGSGGVAAVANECDDARRRHALAAPHCDLGCGSGHGV